MSTTTSTLLLDQTAWDLVLDASGNIAVAAPPYAVAQDVASEVRTFQGECWYDTTRGVPYLTQILGQSPPLAVFKQYMVAAANLVPGVVTAACEVQSFVGRTVIGQVTVTDDSGATSTVGIL